MGTLDYGSLIYLTLQRARTARDAIEVMTNLVARHGYASTGEAFTIGDPAELWILEMVGKAETRGAVWVARRVPDGHVSAHANQARITTFPRDDPENTIFAADVVEFAKAKGSTRGTRPTTSLTSRPRSIRSRSPARGTASLACGTSSGASAAPSASPTSTTPAATT